MRIITYDYPINPRKLGELIADKILRVGYTPSPFILQRLPPTIGEVKGHATARRKGQSAGGKFLRFNC